MRSHLHVRLLLIGGLVGALSWASLASFLRAGLVVAQGGGWTEPINISNTPGGSWYQEIAADDWGRVYIVWSEDLDGKGWGEAIYYTQWDGTSWSQPVDVLLSPDGSGAHIPAIAVDSRGDVHVVWDGQGRNRLYYSGSPVATAWTASSWSKPYLLDDTQVYFSDMAVDNSGNIHVAWEQRYPGESKESELYYLRSRDRGRSWSSPFNLSSSPGESSYMQITVDERDDIHVVWVEQTHGTGGGIGDLSVFYSRSTDEGNSWSDPTNISGEEAGFPTIVARRANEIHVIWTKHDRGSSHEDLYHRMWDGKQWSVPHLVIDGAGKGKVWPRAAVDSAGNIHLVWMSEVEKGEAVYYSWSSDGGQSWSAPFDISQQAPVSVWRADIAISEGNRLHVVWFGGGDIYYATHQTAASWETPLPPLLSTPVSPTATPAKPTPSAAVTATVPPSPTVVTPTENPIGVSGGVAQNSWFPVVVGIVPVLGLVLLVVLVRAGSRRGSW